MIKGHEEAWVDMLLNDKAFLASKGIVVDESNKQQIKDMLMSQISSGSTNSSEKFEDYAVPVSCTNIIKNNTYKMVFPNNTEIIAVLSSVRKGAFFGDDYFFKNIKGGESLCSKSGGNRDEFPIPSGLLSSTKFFSKY